MRNATSTLTPAQTDAIRAQLAGRHIPSGLGTAETPCSIAAINLALSGRLTDEIPDCMSPVIGRWIIVIQDAMPDELRNSDAWRSLLPLAAGTGREREAERLAVIMDWMWGTVLPSVQPIADAGEYGEAWRTMTFLRTEAAAEATAWSAESATESAAWAAARSAEAAAEATAEAELAAEAAAELAARAAAAAAEARAEARAAAWSLFDPCDLLARLIAA